MSHNLADARSKCITVFRQRDLGNFRVTPGMGLYIHIEHYIFLKKQKLNKKLGINVLPLTTVKIATTMCLIRELRYHMASTLSIEYLYFQIVHTIGKKY